MQESDDEDDFYKKDEDDRVLTDRNFMIPIPRRAEINKTRMADAEQLELSRFISKVHKDLRNDSKIIGADNAWNKHCCNKETLKKYADAMYKLSSQCWENNYNKSNATAFSRLNWIFSYCKYYFSDDGITKQRTREEEIAVKIGIEIVPSFINDYEKIKVLDVAIDIAPANYDVYYCDFLNVEVTAKSTLCINDRKILQLPQFNFHLIVFSLFLEYLPSPEQRMLSCKKAYELLCYEGLLIIITPDSKHVGANSKYMKSWRYNLAKVGFSRIKYEKLSHIHCMAFRKSLDLKIASRWADLQMDKLYFNNICIPQDFNNQS
ncbi:hypothetical protein FQR65_LT00318 [Abscondita terminalis]|nr:hypothetical protein FQR65_LT00318 [Abscondita terminalis]